MTSRYLYQWCTECFPGDWTPRDAKHPEEKHTTGTASPIGASWNGVSLSRALRRSSRCPGHRAPAASSRGPCARLLLAPTHTFIGTAAELEFTVLGSEARAEPRTGRFELKRRFEQLGGRSLRSGSVKRGTNCVCRKSYCDAFLAGCADNDLMRRSMMRVRSDEGSSEQTKSPASSGHIRAARQIRPKPDFRNACREIVPQSRDIPHVEKLK